MTGHEGPGSILSFLKKKNWATYLSSGMCFGGIGFGFFHVSVDLTEQGIGKYMYFKIDKKGENLQMCVY